MFFKYLSLSDKVFLGTALALFILLIPSQVVMAYDDTPACFKEIEVNFFSYDVLSEALNMNGVAQSQWMLVYQSLRDRRERIVAQVKNIANQMRPNPLLNPFDPDRAVRILMQVLFAEYSDVMLALNVANPISPVVIRSSFEYIKGRHATRLKACLDSRRLTPNKNPIPY
ncbi:MULTISPECIES: hypothetical protein [Parachlamydia]|jgi:hypothetical protein|uniref:Uncharacterized protein n=2 Tax=Parachlamydia acanthamoebae TaxID=83552 RepID=F8L0X2_PARAV|nr:hypothetical protein [Parachlamydia acanthamoebae]EFB42644.1 hypothetical protein pah_c004o174 [Parachlamydia acanthamoebae str. Hall's coccus]KIA77405.1 hypothetical protein DB43_GI00050 [Parachlamydia acanthamoebae]CCB86882.1 putative uncharacterized protein [Parachlamydia acanthamoebae UV-7]